ncbi:hypothetical protein [Ruania alba]|uniref:Uncharacterized protein n=1 Tax=Ruania alba TaxID=648782 RepID=A0A1H5N837_9MICO|nr:hypothetical protein [Ruania alba]SEE97819.1 hypothetical protein SAMN04488554_4059 [Ruania alba]
MARTELDEWAPDVAEWARTEDFPRPVRWGEVEAAILARKLPRLPEEVWWVTAIGAVGWIVVVLMALPTFGAAVIGLVLAVMGTMSDGVAAEPWYVGARFFFFIAAGLGVSLFVDWWQSRRRAVLQLGASALTAVASGAAFAAVQGDPRAGVWLPLLMLAAAVVSGVVFVLGLISTPEGRPKKRKPPRRGPRSSARRDRARRAREGVLEILVRRELVDVDQDDQTRLREMPLGYWSELDGVDEAEWRRILELRHVGWRDFDASDRYLP